MGDCGRTHTQVLRLPVQAWHRPLLHLSEKQVYLRDLLPDGAPYVLRGGLSGNPVVKAIAVLANPRWACCSLAGGGAGGPSYPVASWLAVHPAFLVEVGML